MGRNVLVVGGAGYIGSFTVDELARRGDRVTVFDNLSYGHREAVHPTAKFVKGELASAGDLRSLFGGEKFDAVIHFAALTSVPESVREPLRYYRGNVECTINLLGEMTRHKVSKLVFSSTAAAYGIPKGELNEDHPTEPINPYGRTKLTVERALSDMAAAGEISAAALRYFNAAGASEDGALGEDHDPETHLIPIVVRAALGLGPEVRIMGTDYETPDGTCIRDYVHVRDLAKAHLLALDRLLAAPKPVFEVYNVGTGRGTSVREIVDAVEEVTGKRVPRDEAPRRAGDPAVLVASSQKLQKSLGWKPEYTEVKDIIRTVAKFFERNPKGYAG